MEQRKLRVIKPIQNNSTEAYGITIPPNIAMFFRDTYFSITKSGTSIILASGTRIADMIKDVSGDLEDYRHG